MDNVRKEILEWFKEYSRVYSDSKTLLAIRSNGIQNYYKNLIDTIKKAEIKIYHKDHH